MDLERAVLVEDLDLVGVGVVGKAERLLEALVQPKRLAVVFRDLQLVAAHRQPRTESLDRELALREVGDVELDHVLAAALAHLRVRREPVAGADRSHRGHTVLLSFCPPIPRAHPAALRGRP